MPDLSVDSLSEGELDRPVARVLAVLMSFTERSEWGVRELAQELELPKSAVHRILHNLARGDMLYATEEPGRFVVGPNLLRLSTLIVERSEIRLIARPLLQELQTATGETTALYLYLPRTATVFGCEVIPSTQAVSIDPARLREPATLMAGAAGLAILASLPPGRDRDVVAKVARDSAMSSAEISALALAARRTGYAVANPGRFEGSLEVAAPVFDALGRLIGAALVVWPESRTEDGAEAAFGQLVHQTAEAISLRLGAQSSEENVVALRRPHRGLESLGSFPSSLATRYLAAEPMSDATDRADTGTGD